MTRAVVVIAALAAIWGGIAHAGPNSITKIEARTLPPRAVLQRVLDQFADAVILPEPIKPVLRAKHPLTDMFYVTRPHGTYVRDLCQADQVRFGLDPVGADDQGADAAMKVSGISVRNTFRFLASPSSSSRNQSMSSAEHRELKKRCAQLDPETVFFDADDDEVAEQGGLLLLAILKDAASGALPTSYDCEGYTAKECSETVRQAAIDKLMLVKRCHAFTADQRGECMEIWSQFVGLTVLSEGYGDKLKIIHVKVSEIVTMADPRED